MINRGLPSSAQTVKQTSRPRQFLRLLPAQAYSYRREDLQRMHMQHLMDDFDLINHKTTHDNHVGHG
jgi:hypothetical protein